MEISSTTEESIAIVKDGRPAIHQGALPKEALEDLDLTQAEFARALGVSPMRVSKAEARAKAP